MKTYKVLHRYTFDRVQTFLNQLTVWLAFLFIAVLGIRAKFLQRNQPLIEALHSPVGSHQALADQLDSHDHKSAQKNRHKRHSCAGVGRRFAGLLTHVDSRATAVLTETCLGGQLVMNTAFSNEKARQTSCVPWARARVRPAQFTTRSIGTESGSGLFMLLLPLSPSWQNDLRRFTKIALEFLPLCPQQERQAYYFLRFLGSTRWNNW